MYKQVSLLIAAAIAALALAIFQPVQAQSTSAPKIDRIYFITTGAVGLPNIMVIEGKGFTVNSRVLIDGHDVNSTFSGGSTLYVHIDPCTAPDRHTVVVENPALGGSLKSKVFKAEFCLQE